MPLTRCRASGHLLGAGRVATRPYWRAALAIVGLLPTPAWGRCPQTPRCLRIVCVALCERCCRASLGMVVWGSPVHFDHPNLSFIKIFWGRCASLGALEGMVCCVAWIFCVWNGFVYHVITIFLQIALDIRGGDWYLSCPTTRTKVLVC